MQTQATYKDGTTARLTDKAIKFFEKHDSFIFQGVIDIELQPEGETFENLFNWLLKEYPFNDDVDYFSIDAHQRINDEESYIDDLKLSIFEITINDILDGSFNETSFYNMLIEDGYLIELE